MRILLLVLFTVMLSSYCIAQDSTSYADYYGKYKMPDGMDISEVTIVWSDSTLNIDSDMGNARMDKLGEDSFHMDYEDGTIQFTRDSSTHKVNGMIIHVSGMDIDAIKEAEEMKANGTSWIRKELIDDKILLN
jgi:hypothetical protein